VALINGEEHPSSDRGFWSNGLRQTVTVETQEGFEVRVTWDHKMQTTRGMVKASELLEGDKLVLTDARKGIPEWGGPGSFDEGWLLGWLLADGTFSDDATAKLDFYGSKKELLQDALFRLEAQDYRLDRVTSQRVGCLSEGADRTSVSSRGLARLAEEYGVTRSSKNATAALGQTSSRFAQGFLQAYMEADGCVCLGTKKGAGRSLQVTSIWRRNLLLMQQMLLRLGIRSRVWSGLNDKDVSMPDGKGGQALYRSKPAFRLDISGAHDIFRYRDLIGFTLPDKAEKLEALVASYRKVYKPKPMVARVQNVTPFDYEEVYDCSIPSLGVFEANGIIVSNCLEVFLESRGTCLLLHENLGACTIADIAPGMVQGMKELLELHPRTGVGESGEYLKPAEDRQVGLGLLGLANLLAQEGVTYRQLADALEEFLGDNEKKPVSRYSATAMAIVRALSQGITQSAALARAAGMERAFCIAPTATCSYKSRDLRGYACAPEIAPPVARHVDRDSGTFGVETVAYPPDIEIAKEVGYDTFRRVADGIVRLFEETGLFHGYSLNSWSDEVTYDRDFIENWAQSPQTSLYYSLQVAPDTQAKDSVAVASSDESGVGAEIFGFDDEEPAAACSMDSPGFCSACAE
jgi:intein/homing endonuclease